MCFGCSKEPSHRDGSFEYPQHMFWLRNKKNNFLVRSLILRPGLTLFYHTKQILMTVFIIVLIDYCNFSYVGQISIGKLKFLIRSLETYEIF